MQYLEFIRSPEKVINRSLYGDPEPAAQPNVLGEVLAGKLAVDETLANASVAQVTPRPSTLNPKP